jgi:hypothetical protein
MPQEIRERDTYIAASVHMTRPRDVWKGTDVSGKTDQDQIKARMNEAPGGLRSTDHAARIAVVGSYGSHTAAEASVKALQRVGFDRTKLSIVGKDYRTASFTVRHLVVDTGGWLGGRKVLISPVALRDIDWRGRRIAAALTKAQVEKSPLIDTDRPVSRQQEIECHRYYGYPSYWTGPYLWGAFRIRSRSQIARRASSRNGSGLGRMGALAIRTCGARPR